MRNRNGSLKVRSIWICRPDFVNWSFQQNAENWSFRLDKGLAVVLNGKLPKDLEKQNCGFIEENTGFSMNSNEFTIKNEKPLLQTCRGSTNKKKEWKQKLYWNKKSLDRCRWKIYEIKNTYSLKRFMWKNEIGKANNQNGLLSEIDDDR